MIKIKRLLLMFLVTQTAFGYQATINSFTSGEMSPLMDGRLDLNKYYNGCKTLKNMLVLNQGGVERRPGTRFISEIKDSNQGARLIPFQYSTTDAYVIEAGDKYFRFYRNGGQIIDPNTLETYELTTVFDSNELFAIQYVQSADVMYFACPNHPPQKLIRYDHASWEINDVNFTTGPFLDENKKAIFLDPNGKTGNITISSDVNVFEANHVGSLWRLAHPRDDAEIYKKFPTVGYSDSMPVKGHWTFYANGGWTGTVVIERSYDDGGTWEDYRLYEAAAGYGNPDTEGDELDDDVLYRIGRTVDDGGTVYLWLRVDSYYYNGIVRITAYTNPKLVSATVIKELGKSTVTKRWSEGAWSKVRGYPRTVDFYQERLMFAATTKEPLRMWFSKSSDYENMANGDYPDDALRYTLSRGNQDKIEWANCARNITIGTSGAMFQLEPMNPDEGLSIDNPPETRSEIGIGVEPIPALLADHTLLAVQEGGKKVREVTYSLDVDSIVAPEMTVLSGHITGTGIKQAALQKLPQQLMWCVLNDGNLAAMTYERNDNVVGWHRHNTDGLFESVASISASNESQIWFVVARDVNGQTKRFVEQMQPRDWGEDQNDCWFVDSGLNFDGGPSVVITAIDINSVDGKVTLTAAGNTFESGDNVKITDVGGATWLNRKVFTAVDIDGNDFRLKDESNAIYIDGNDFGAYTTGGTVLQVEKNYAIPHLDGETLDCLADGMVHPDVDVSNGNIELNGYYNKVTAGFPYRSVVEPMPLELSPDTSTKPKQISAVIVNLYKSLGCRVGRSFTNAEQVRFRTATSAEGPEPLYTGEKMVNITGDFRRKVKVVVFQDEPLPLTVLSVSAQVELGD